jgi:hypothetical protein
MRSQQESLASRRPTLPTLSGQSDAFPGPRVVWVRLRKSFHSFSQAPSQLWHREQQNLVVRRVPDHSQILPRMDGHGELRIVQRCRPRGRPEADG